MPHLSGGVNVVDGTYPFFVGVFAQNFFLCGGIILNANHVLTAGTCLMYGDNILYFSNQITVTFGSNVITTNTARLNVFALYVHPQLNTFTVVNDIGVIRTATNFDFPFQTLPLVAPAVINDWIVADNFVCQVVAWNLVANVQTQQVITNHPIVNRDICNNLPVNLGRINESMICAGLTNAGAGVCPQNLGGALVCNGRVHGILSSGFGCGVGNAINLIDLEMKY